MVVGVESSFVLKASFSIFSKKMVQPVRAVPTADESYILDAQGNIQPDPNVKPLLSHELPLSKHAREARPLLYGEEEVAKKGMSAKHSEGFNNLVTLPYSNRNRNRTPKAVQQKELMAEIEANLIANDDTNLGVEVAYCLVN